METISELVKFKFLDLYKAIESGDISHLLKMGNVGVFKYKHLIAKGISYEVNSFSETSPYRDVWKMIYRANGGNLTDGFKEVVNDIFSGIIYDLENGVKVRDDVILTLTSMYFVGALTNQAKKLAQLKGWDNQYLADNTNVGYYDVLCKKIALLKQSRDSSRRGERNAYDEQIVINNEAARPKPTFELSSLTTHESIVKPGNWEKVAAPTLPVMDLSKKADVLPEPEEEIDFFEGEEVFTEPMKSTTVEASDDVNDEFNLIELENEMTDKIYEGERTGNRDVDLIIQDAEEKAESTMNREIRMAGTDRAERAKQNAIWHAKRAAGEIPEDEELPEHLQLFSSSTEKQDTVFSEALAGLKARNEDKTDKVDPLDVPDTINSNPVDELSEQSREQEYPVETGKGRDPVFPENFFNTNGTDNMFVINSESSEHCAMKIDTTPKYTFDTMVSTADVSITDSRFVEIASADIELPATQLLETGELMIIFKETESIRSTEAHASITDKEAIRSEIETLVKTYILKSALAEPTIYEIDGKAHVFSEKGLRRLSVGGKFVITPQGLPVMLTEKEDKLYMPNAADFMLNGIITDAYLNAFMSAYGSSKVPNFSMAANSLEPSDSFVDSQVARVQKSERVIGVEVPFITAVMLS